MIKADMKSMRVNADLAQDQQASREAESVAERATQLEMSGYLNHTAEHSCGDLTSSQRTSGYATPATNVSSAGTVPFEQVAVFDLALPPMSCSGIHIRRGVAWFWQYSP